MYIDHKLTWKEHISSVCQKVAKCTAIINRIKHIVNKDSLRFLYTSLIEPHLTYCVEVWGNAYKSNLHPLYVKQKRVIRLVCKTGYLEHTAELFKSLCVLPFYDLVKYKIAIFMYKVFHKTLLMTVLMLFMQNHSSYRTRQSKNFFLSYARTNKKQRCIVYSGTCIWNSINSSLKMSKDIRTFKAIFKKRLMF